jgi:hypothetical protein
VDPVDEYAWLYYLKGGAKKIDRFKFNVTLI